MHNEAIVDTVGKNDSTNAIISGNQDGTAEAANVRLQGAGGGCKCGGDGNKGTSTTPVYAIGRIKTRFPTLGIEKELTQIIGRIDTAGQTDWQAIHAVLSKRENRYLARKLCWVMTIEGLETYLLMHGSGGAARRRYRCKDQACPNPRRGAVMVGPSTSVGAPKTNPGRVLLSVTAGAGVIADAARRAGRHDHGAAVSRAVHTPILRHRVDLHGM